MKTIIGNKLSNNVLGERTTVEVDELSIETTKHPDLYSSESPLYSDTLRYDGLACIVLVTSAGFDAGNFAKIEVNGEQVKLKKNASNHYRGLHIVVVDPSSGSVVEAQVFDTYKCSKGLDDFIRKGVAFGHFVVAASQDDCVTNLSSTAKDWFQAMGSKAITQLKYR